MYSLVKKLVNLKPYAPITGQYRIRLDANESFIKPSAHLLNKVVLDLNRYPDPYAVKAVNAFADLYRVNPAFITAGNGSDELISLICGCFLEKGNRVLYLAPDFSMYSFYSSIYELELFTLDKEPDLSINMDKVIQAVADNGINCVIFSNPCNPTSLGINASEIKKLITSTNALVVIDEAYMEFWNNEESLLCDVQDYDNLIVLKTCSKAIALAGIRLGFAVSNEKLTTAMKAAKSPYNTNSITQEIGYLVLSDKDEVRKNIEIIKGSIKNLYSSIIKADFPFFIKVYETRTNFLFIEVENADNIYNYLLEQGIAVRLMGRYLRITCGTDYENNELINALKKFKSTDRNKIK